MAPYLKTLCQRQRYAQLASSMEQLSSEPSIDSHKRERMSNSPGWRNSINSLPHVDGVLDRRALAFREVDRFSTVLVGSTPKSVEAIGNSDFHLAYAAYMGVPPQCLKAYVRKLKCGKGDEAGLLDLHGDRLASANTSGDGWRRRHDQVKWTGDHWLSHALIEHTTEVNGLFAATINQEAAKNIDTRTRQGLVPDFGITRMTAAPWSSGNSNV